MEGTKLGKYEIRTELGRGAMGTVYEAWDPAIERKVAIKTVNLPAGDVAEAKAMLDRFKREAQAAGRLHHPNIVDVFDYGEGEGFAYIVMEFVEGRSLKSILDAGERLSMSHVLRVMEDLLAGLQCSHQHGVIHRDIKPANIMMTPEGLAKIADFGVARIESSTMTQAGTIIGTPAYMPPEQFMGQPADARSDIYSSGVVLYQLLTGERPFEGSLSSIMHKVLNTRPPKPSDLSVTAPPALDTVVARAMALRPEDRYFNAAEFATAIREAMEPHAAFPPPIVDASVAGGEATVVVPRQTAATPATPAPPPVRRTSLPILAGAILVVGILAVGTWLVVRQYGPAPPETSKVAQVSAQPSSPSSPVPPQPSAVQEMAPERVPSPGQASEAPARLPEPSQPITQPELKVTTSQESKPTQSQTSPVQTTEPKTEPSPSSATQRTEEEQKPKSSQLALVVPPPPESRRAVRDAIATVPCVLVSGDVTRAGTALELRAFVAANAESHLRTAVGNAAPALSVDWHIETLSETSCSALELIRPLVAKFGLPGSGLAISTGEGRTHLREGDRIVLQITTPNYPSRVRLDDLQSDGTVYHMQPSDAYPSSEYKPLSQFRWGEARSALDEPAVVQAPFGTELLVAIATSGRPLLPEKRPQTEPAEVYLRDLRAAIEAAQTRREIVTAAALVLTTSKHP